jgi:RNA polymerase-binding transcription factor DksA
VQTSEQRLQDELKRLEEQIAALKSNLDETPDYTRGVGDPRITRWELDRALLEQLESRAETLNQALERVDAGVYGICERCGKPIHPDRLAVLPDTRLCIECARQQ